MKASLDERWDATREYYTRYGINATYRTEAPCLQMTKAVLTMLGATVLREAFGTRKGIADIIACYNGRFVAFECKSLTGHTTHQQEQFLAEVRASGGIAEVIRCPEDIFKALNNFRR